MNKTQLVAAITDSLNEGVEDQGDAWTKGDVVEVLTHFENVITESTASGEKVTLPGFCKFARVDRPARTGRNPATGETIKIKAKRAVRITPLKAFKDTVMNGKKR
jgi:DNA-binding protein HU-beta